MGKVVWVWLMRAVRAYGEGWCVYRIAVGVSASATRVASASFAMLPVHISSLLKF